MKSEVMAVSTYLSRQASKSEHLHTNWVDVYVYRHKLKLPMFVPASESHVSKFIA